MEDEALEEAKATSRRYKANLKIAMHQMCGDGQGGLNKNAKMVLAHLYRECNGSGQYGFPRDSNGALDPIAMARWAGRREVFDLLVRLLAVKLDERHNLRE